MKTDQELQVRDCSCLERCLDGVDHNTVLFMAVAAMCELSWVVFSRRTEPAMEKGKILEGKSWLVLIKGRDRAKIFVVVQMYDVFRTV